MILLLTYKLGWSSYFIKFYAVTVCQPFQYTGCDKSFLQENIILLKTFIATLQYI